MENPKEKLEIEKIFLGSCLTWGLTSKNILYGWGINIFGQLGAGQLLKVPEETIILPNQYCSLKEERVIKVVNKGTHSLLLTDKSNIFSTGDSANMATGLIGPTNYFKKIEFFQHQKIDDIDVGLTHSGALVEGRLWIWGKVTKKLSHTIPTQY